MMHERTLFIRHNNPAGLQHRVGPGRAKRRNMRVETFLSLHAGLIAWYEMLHALVVGFRCASPVSVLQTLLAERHVEPWEAINTLIRIARRNNLINPFDDKPWEHPDCRIQWSRAILAAILWRPGNTLLTTDAPIDWELHDLILLRPWPR